MIKVGDKLYCVEIGNLARVGFEPKHYYVTVIKVGRKYFTAERSQDGIKRVVFHIDDLSEKTNICQSHRLYESRQSYLDALRYNEIYSAMRDAFNHVWALPKHKFTIDQLEKAVKILGMEV